MNLIYFLDLIDEIKEIKSKSDLRQVILDFRNTISENEVISMSREIFKKFLSINKIKDSSKFMLYCDFRNEVATKEIIQILLESGKEVYLPVTIRKEKKLLPKRIFSLDDLVSGTYGILEPHPDAPSINPSFLDVIVVPGSVFDINGYRTGYGGGYYDRFLENLNAIKVGVCFDFQLTDDVLPEKHDKKMDFIITEKQILTLS